MTFDTIEKYTYDDMQVKLDRVNVFVDPVSGWEDQIYFDVEIQVAHNVLIENSFDALHDAHGWIREQLAYPKSLLILKYRK